MNSVPEHLVTASESAPALQASIFEVSQQAGKPPIMQVESAGEPSRWVSRHRDALRDSVTLHGSVLIRGLGIRDIAEAAAVFAEFGSVMTEREAFAPRRAYADGVYSSSNWPANYPMCMHHELSYALEFPGLLLFACLVAPEDGGATPVAESQALLRSLPAELVEPFERDGWLLVRNYNEDIGASLVEAFGTEDRAAVERYCHANAIRFDWQPDGGLRTRQRRSAIVNHPLTGERCWFNQIAFLNKWTIDPEVREYLVDCYGEDGLPFNTRFGNGEPIGEDVVRLINDAYETVVVSEPWQAGDLMLVDNVRTAHGREPFDGAREIVVGMVDATALADCAPTVDVTAGA
jgi:alpha-ketoglutarate-dependent taurine dioxygenase